MDKTPFMQDVENPESYRYSDADTVELLSRHKDPEFDSMPYDEKVAYVQSNRKVYDPLTPGSFYHGGKVPFHENYTNATAQELGIDPRIAQRLVHNESNGNWKAVSDQGAIGLTQLLPSTAKAFKARPDADPTKNPWDNIDAGLNYYAHLKKKYGSDYKAIAAYHAGETNLDKFGIASLTDPRKNPKTAEYVSRFRDVLNLPPVVGRNEGALAPPLVKTREIPETTEEAPIPGIEGTGVGRINLGAFVRKTFKSWTQSGAQFTASVNGVLNMAARAAKEIPYATEAIKNAADNMATFTDENRQRAAQAILDMETTEAGTQAKEEAAGKELIKPLDYVSRLIGSAPMGIATFKMGRVVAGLEQSEAAYRDALERAARGEKLSPAQEAVFGFILGAVTRHYVGKAFDFLHFAPSWLKKTAGTGVIGGLQGVPQMMQQQRVPTTPDQAWEFVQRNAPEMGQGAFDLIMLQLLTGGLSPIKHPVTGRVFTFREAREVIAYSNQARKEAKLSARTERKEAVKDWWGRLWEDPEMRRQEEAERAKTAPAPEVFKPEEAVPVEAPVEPPKVGDVVSIDKESGAQIYRIKEIGEDEGGKPTYTLQSYVVDPETGEYRTKVVTDKTPIFETSDQEKESFARYEARHKSEYETAKAETPETTAAKPSYGLAKSFQESEIGVEKETSAKRSNAWRTFHDWLVEKHGVDPEAEGLQGWEFLNDQVFLDFLKSKFMENGEWTASRKTLSNYIDAYGQVVAHLNQLTGDPKVVGNKIRAGEPILKSPIRHNHEALTRATSKAPSAVSPRRAFTPDESRSIANIANERVATAEAESKAAGDSPDSIMTEMKALRDRALVYLGVRAGLRTEDASAMRVGNLSLGRRVAYGNDMAVGNYLEFTESKITKGAPEGRDRRIDARGFGEPMVLTQDAVKALKDYLDFREAVYGKGSNSPDAPLFSDHSDPAFKNLPKMEQRDINQAVQSFFDQVSPDEKLSWTNMRHTFVTDLSHNVRDARLRAAIEGRKYSEPGVGSEAGYQHPSAYQLTKAMEVMEGKILPPPERSREAMPKPPTTAATGEEKKARKRKNKPPPPSITPPPGFEETPEEGPPPGTPKGPGLIPPKKGEFGYTTTESEPGIFEGKKQPETPEDMRGSTITERPGGVIGKSEIVDYFRRAFSQINLLVGKVGRGAAGHAETISGSQTIRTRFANDLRTISHEMFHNIYEWLWPEMRRPTGVPLPVPELQPWRDVLDPIGTKPNAVSSPTMEGFAEFGFKYIYRGVGADGKLKPLGPVGSRMNEFTQWFEQKLEDTYPGLREKLQNTAILVDAYQSQDPMKKAIAQMAYSQEQGEFFESVEERISTRLNRIYGAMVDRNYMAPRVEEIVNADRAKKGLPPLSPSEKASFAIQQASGSAGRIALWTGMGRMNRDAVPLGAAGRPVLADDGMPIKNYHQIMSMLSTQETKIAVDTLLAMRALKEKEIQYRTMAEVTGRHDPGWRNPFTPEQYRAMEEYWRERPVTWQLEVEPFLKEWARFVQGRLNYMVETGMINADLKEELRTRFPDYAPVYRAITQKTGQPWMFQTYESKPGVSGKYEGKRSFIKRSSYGGSDLEIISPMDSMLKDTALIITGSMRQKVGRQFVDLVKQLPAWGRILTPTDPDLKSIRISKDQILNLFSESVRYITTEQRSASVNRLSEILRETIEGGVSSVTDLGRVGSAMRNQIHDALKTRGRTANEADFIIDRMVAEANKAKGQSEEQAMRTITKIVEKTIDREVVIDRLKEAVLEPPENKHLFFRSKAKPHGVAGRDTVIEVLKNGKPEWYEILNKDVYDFFKHRDQIMDADVKRVWKMFSFPAAMLRAGATLSPAFSLVKNLWRDTAQAFVYQKHGVFIPFASTAKGILMLMPWLNYKPWRDTLHKWENYGGPRAALVAMDRYGTRKQMEALMEKTAPEWAADKVKHPFRSALEILQAASETIETATRLSSFDISYKALKRKRYPEADAIALAIDASKTNTLDYNRAGHLGRKINYITAFFNANIQGADKFLKEFRIDKDGIKNPGVWLRALIGITLPSLFNAFYAHDDPGYKDAPWYWKDLFWVIPHPARRGELLKEYQRLGRVWENWTPEEKAAFNKKYMIFKFPKPFELGIIFGTLPERAMAWTLDRQAGTQQGGQTIYHQFGRYMVEGLPGNMWNSFMPGVWPTAALPVYEALNNRSMFTDRPIIPLTKENAPPTAQYGNYTTEAAKAMAKALDIVFHPINVGDKNNWNPLDITRLNSPVVVEHYIRSYGGSLGTIMLKAVDGLMKIGLQDRFVRQYEEKLGVSFENMTPQQRMEVARGFSNQSSNMLFFGMRNPPTNRVWLDFRMDPAKAMSDHWFFGSFAVRYPSANTESVRRFFDHVKASKDTENYLESTYMEREVAPWKYEKHLAALKESGKEYRLGIAKSKDIKKVISEISDLLKTVDVITYNSAMLPEEKERLRDMMYFAVIDRAKAGNMLYEKARDARKIGGVK